jgi:hypothetical protein
MKHQLDNVKGEARQARCGARTDLDLASGCRALRRDAVASERWELTAEGLEFFQEITAGRGSTESLFHRAGAAWGKSHQQRPLADACQAAKINPPASFHTLRHT